MAVTREEKMWEAMLNDAPERIPTAVTRKERMLQNLAKQACDNDTFSGGGSGGVSSWNELGEKTDKKVWLASYTTDPEFKGVGILDLGDAPNLVKGDKYFVVWDGVTYELAVTEYGTMYSTYEVLGNSYLVDSEWGNNTGEPFGITTRAAPYNSFAFAYDGSEPHTVEIYQVSKTITPIPPEYLPVPTIWVNSDGTMELNCTIDKLEQCFEAGIMPLMRYVDDNYTYCCTVAGRMDDKFGFTFGSDIVLNVSYADGTVTQQGGK